MRNAIETNTPTYTVKQSKVDKKEIDYTSHSTTYDEKRFEGKRNEYIESLRRRAVLKLMVPGDMARTIVDVGCGTARGLLYLGKHGYSNLTGLDYTQAMLDIGARKLREQLPNQSMRLLRGDAFSLPFPTESFDTVISHNFIHMFRFDRQQELLKEMYRICKPGGQMIVEFDSIHKGLFLSRYLEQRRVRHRTKFNSLWEIGRLFPRDKYLSVKVFGAELPMASRFLKHTPRLGRFIESITLFPPFNWLSARVVVGAIRR